MSERIRAEVVFADEETKRQGQEQAKKLGLSFSAYVNLIIKLDVATGIIERLNRGESVDNE